MTRPGSLAFLVVGFVVATCGVVAIPSALDSTVVVAVAATTVMTSYCGWRRYDTAGFMLVVVVAAVVCGALIPASVWVFAGGMLMAMPVFASTGRSDDSHKRTQ